MKLLMMRFCLSCLTALVLTACGSSKDADPVPAPEPAAIPEEPVTPVNPLTASKWCRAEDWDTFQLVTRMSFVGERLLMENLLVVPGGFKTYEYEQKMNWEVKGPMASVPNKMSISLHETDLVIQALPGFATQKKIADEIFRNNPDLTHPEGVFAPVKAMTVLTRSVTSGEEIVRRVYPCENYSSTFNTDGPQRPLMELLMLLGSESTDYTDGGRTGLSKTMPFAYPINVIQADEAQLTGSQWCSWREVASGELLLRTLTIGHQEFIENAHSQIFTNYTDDQELLQYLQNNATRSERYQMTMDQGRLFGRNLTPAETQAKYPLQELFAVIRDANGTEALVRMDDKEPDRTWPVFSDIFYSCSDPRPLVYNEPFRIRLADILSFQQQQQQGL